MCSLLSHIWTLEKYNVDVWESTTWMCLITIEKFTIKMCGLEREKMEMKHEISAIFSCFHNKMTEGMFIVAFFEVVKRSGSICLKNGNLFLDCDEWVEAAKQAYATNAL